MYALYLAHFDDHHESVAAIFDYKPSESKLFEFIKQEYNWITLFKVEKLLQGETITDIEVTNSWCRDYTYSLSLREINTWEWL